MNRTRRQGKATSKVGNEAGNLLGKNAPIEMKKEREKQDGEIGI